MAKRRDAAERGDVAEHEEAERLCLLVYAGTASHQYLCVWTPAINCGTHDIFEERKCYVHGSPKQIAFFCTSAIFERLYGKKSVTDVHAVCVELLVLV